MIRLNRLPEFTDKALATLRADQSMKAHIIATASSSPESVRRVSFRNLVPIVCCFSAIALVLFFGLSGRFFHQGTENRPMFTVASHTSVSPLSLQRLLSDRSSD